VRTGEWNAPDKDQKNILALYAKLENPTKAKRSQKSERNNEILMEKESPQRLHVN